MEWTLVASEEPLGIGSEGVMDSLRKSQLHLLVMDNEERDALALEIDDGEDAGTAGRLRRMTGKGIEAVLEFVEVLHDEDGQVHEGRIRKLDTASFGEGALHTKTVALEVVRAEVPEPDPGKPGSHALFSPELDAWDREGREY